MARSLSGYRTYYVRADVEAAWSSFFSGTRLSYLMDRTCKIELSKQCC